MRGAGGHHGGSGARESLHLMQVSLNDCLCYGAAAAAGDVAATQGLVDRLHVLKEIMVRLVHLCKGAPIILSCVKLAVWGTRA